jgi:hypothetical protein
MNTEVKTYPVHVRGELTTPLSRWLWLVKWILAIPHIFVLAILAIPFCIFSFLAFFAILFAGKYPRSMFDFNVGWLRWGWRVGFYCYQAMGTDKYPPFSLEPDPNYPADLDIEYPEKLSHLKVLVKWFLLIPHWIIYGIFNSGRGGLIVLLSLVSVIILLFTGEYPQEIFKIIIGMNRWSFRVMAYVMMRDEYPPFRLED